MAAIFFDYELFGELTVDIPYNTTKYVKVSGISSSLLFNVILDTGATATIAVALESPSYVVANQLADSALNWTDIVTPTSITIASIAANIYYKTVASPCILKITNTTITNKNVRICLKGIR